MTNRGIHKAYSRSFNYHTTQGHRRHQSPSPSMSLRGHKKLDDSVPSAVGRPHASEFGDELTVNVDASRPRSRSQTNIRVTSKSSSPKPRRSHPETFTDQQKALLRHSWSRVGKHGHSGIGAMIFRRVFERRPAIRRMFEFGTIPASRLDNDPTFESHARSFVNIIDGAIKALDTFEFEYAPELQAKGRYHAQFADRGFESQYWDIFAEAMTDSAVEWIGPGKHRETVKAWTLLVWCIIKHMRIGYDDEIRRRRKLASQTNGQHSPHGSQNSYATVPPGYPNSNGHTQIRLQVHED